MKTPRFRALPAAALLATTAALLIGCGKAPDVAPAPPITMGTQIDDASVTGRVKSALLADPDIKSLDISVITLKGQVQLSGFVNSQGQIDQAVKLARNAEGASSVKNELAIKQ